MSTSKNHVDEHYEDEYGYLGQARLNESDSWLQGEITAAEFEAAWTDDR